jgi:cytochrome c2
MRWLTRTLVGLTMAGIAGAGVLLDRRGRRRASQVRAPRKPAARVTPVAPQARDDSDDPPLLSPTWFGLSHFSMLVVLLAMMVGGLAMRGLRRYPAEPTWSVHGGDADRGRQVLRAHGCGGCHTISGIGEATGNVGPSLEGFAQRMFIGGQLANTPENLVAWLQNPQRYAPGTAMPNLPVTEPAARDMAAYLYANP